MENTYSDNSFQKTINIADIINAALRHWQKLLIIVLVCFVVFASYAAFIATPLYNSTAKLYIVDKSKEQVTVSDLNISTYLARDMIEILKDDVIISEVAKKTGNKYSNGQIRSFLQITTTADTRIITVTAQSPNPEDSKKIADSVCDVAENKLPEIIGLDRVKIIRYGSVAKTPSSPNITTSCLLGILTGIAISIALVAFIVLTNNKISSAEDVEKILGIPVLTTVPYTQNKSKK